nr:MAG TPA: hypothetical protein [Caudoviricetes sp.]
MCTIKQLITFEITKVSSILKPIIIYSIINYILKRISYGKNNRSRLIQ